MSPLTEIADPAVVRTEITEYLGNVLDEAQALCIAIKDDETAERATVLGVAIKSRIVWLKKKKEEISDPLMAAAERVRDEYLKPIQLGTQYDKSLSAAVIKYRGDKKREEDRLRLAAEAEARRKREEAAEKERAAERERLKIIKDREAREQKARDDAAAEERRKQAEIEAGKQAERQRLQKEQAERDQRIKEEETARLKKAQEAQDVGLPERVDRILETPTAIAEVAKPLPTSAEVAAKAETERKEREAQAEAERKREAAAAEEKRLREEEGERMRKLQEDADRAKADADAEESMAAAQVSVSAADNRMRTSGRWQYAIDDEPSFMRLVTAVAQGRAPIAWLTGAFDLEAKAPKPFRAQAIGKYVADLKNDPDASRKQADLLALGIRAWLSEGGTFKADEGAEI